MTRIILVLIITALLSIVADAVVERGKAK